MAINRAEVGVHVAGNLVEFGIYLPGIHVADGFEVKIRIIHRLDQFAPEIPSVVASLSFDPSHPLGRWFGKFDIVSLSDVGNFGKSGEYLYRYELWRSGKIITKHFADPFATKVGPGFLSVFEIGASLDFIWTDDHYKTPSLADLVVYELQVQEFNTNFDGLIERLDYLQGLGVNCLELMPINPITRGYDWGYGPLGYFACEESFGGPDALKHLVDVCHSRNMAVILDVVFGHAAEEFPYAKVYNDSGVPNPMMQTPNRDGFGRGVEWSFTFSQQYFLEVTKHMLDEFHVDGFRYDNVPGFYDGPTGNAYAKLAFDTYVYSRTIERFKDTGGFSRIIQCAEYLDNPQRILRDTYSNSTWQDGLLGKVRDMARWNYVDDGFAHLLDTSFQGYPSTKNAVDAGDTSFPVAPFQYIETHDHSRFIASFGLDTKPGDELQFGKRDLFYKTQAYAICLMTASGVPMLFQGQEFAENYVIPDNGNGRVGIRRGLHWEYFYDENGQALVRLYRRLGKLRAEHRSLRRGDFFYDNVHSSTAHKLLIFRRFVAAEGTHPEEHALIVVNFSEQNQSVPVPFPKAGTYTELLDLPNSQTPTRYTAHSAGELINVPVNSNYGVILIL